MKTKGTGGWKFLPILGLALILGGTEAIAQRTPGKGGGGSGGGGRAGGNVTYNRGPSMNQAPSYRSVAPRISPSPQMRIPSKQPSFSQPQSVIGTIPVKPQTYVQQPIQVPNQPQTFSKPIQVPNQTQHVSPRLSQPLSSSIQPGPGTVRPRPEDGQNPVYKPGGDNWTSPQTGPPNPLPWPPQAGADRVPGKRTEGTYQPGNSLAPNHPPHDGGEDWNRWGHEGDRIRQHWRHQHFHHPYHDWYRDDWWGIHFHPRWNYHNYCYNCNWWSCPPNWGFVTSFVAVPLPPQPVYYTYGSGGNVYFEGNTIVLEDGRRVPVETYTQDVIALANSIPDVDPNTVEWMPLGVFSMVDGEERDPTILIQLTISKEGIIAGMYQDTVTGVVLPLEGMSDQETSKVVWRPVDQQFPIAETGLYNLIQAQTQILVHFEDGSIQERLLIRLEEPEGDPETKAEGGN